MFTELGAKLEAVSFIDKIHQAARVASIVILPQIPASGFAIYSRIVAARRVLAVSRLGGHSRSA